jgi:hypothetical protein
MSINEEAQEPHAPHAPHAFAEHLAKLFDRFNEHGSAELSVARLDEELAKLNAVAHQRVFHPKRTHALSLHYLYLSLLKRKGKKKKKTVFFEIF